MDKVNWIQLLVGFLSGGALGALIKIFVDNRKNRIQPIGRKIEIKPFYDAMGNKLVNSRVTISDSGKEYKFSKLYTGIITIANTGHHDYAEFSFGITAPIDAKFIHLNPVSSDRHHKADVQELPTLENQINSFDIILKPFNRKDNYSFDILMTTDTHDLTLDDITISTSHSIKWVELVSTSEIVFEIAKKTVLTLGPLDIGLRIK